MLRLNNLAGLLPAALLAFASPATAETVFEYDLRSGHDSNLFQDTNQLSGAFIEAEAKLRGTIEIEGSDFSYGIWHREKRLQKYTFGNQHASGLSLGYKTKLADTVEFSIEGSVSRNATGDVLLAIPGSVIGYRNTDWTYGLSTSLAAELMGGKNTLTASVSRLDRGKAHFTSDLFLPGKLEADVTALELSASHIRPAFSGELGFNVVYRSTYIPSSEQMLLMRLPASTLRGSIAYGRKLGDNLTMVAEFGVTGIRAGNLGPEVKKIRPYVHTALEWKPVDPVTLAVGYDQDYSITDLDDPLGEYIGTIKFAAGLKLAPRLNAKLSYEIAASEWLYYLYDTKTRRFAGTLSFDIAEKHRLDLEYRHIDRREKDPNENFTGNQYIARIHGSF